MLIFECEDGFEDWSDPSEMAEDDGLGHDHSHAGHRH